MPTDEKERKFEFNSQVKQSINLALNIIKERNKEKKEVFKKETYFLK
jgi:hypothetical protein